MGMAAGKMEVLLMIGGVNVEAKLANKEGDMGGGDDAGKPDWIAAV